MSEFLKIIISIVLISSILLWFFTRNKMDNDWVELKNLDISKIETLHNSPKKLDSLFESFQNKKVNYSNQGTEVISKPYVPIIEFEKFTFYVNQLQKEKFIILSGVEGGGATKLVTTIAKFVAEDDDTRMLNVRCAPKFDLIYHKKYIGETVNGKFKKGVLLKFWETCFKNPSKKHIAIFDDLDKINPETLFGPDLWAHLSSKRNKLIYDRKEITIPPNFYMISTTLSAVEDRVQFHNEHFKRIGKDYFLKPNTIELALYLNSVKTKLNKTVAKNGIENLSVKEKKQHHILNNKREVLEYLFLFKKINKIIEKNFSKSSQLAQWSSLRKLFLLEQRDEFLDIIISHVNSMQPNKIFNKSNLKPIFYTFKNDGLERGSSPLAIGFKVFKEWGFLTEFVVAICFALVTALIGLYLNSKRKKKVTNFLLKSEQVYLDFENQKLTTEDAINKLSDIKTEIESQTAENKISFPEAIFFYNSVRVKVNSIEISKNINATFLVLMDVFLDDEVLSKSEYDKLVTFLDKIKNNIPLNDYTQMKTQVNEAWDKFGEN